MFSKDLVKKMNEKQKKRYDIFLFLVRFFLLSFILHFLIWLNLDMRYIQIFVADTIYFILNFFVISIPKTGSFFILSDSSGKIIAEITRDCIAWKSILAYICLIFATQINLGKNKKEKNAFIYVKKIRAMLGGSILIFLANIVRLTTTFALVQAYGIKYFDIIHNILWQGGMVLIIILLWDYMRRKYLIL